MSKNSKILPSLVYLKEIYFYFLFSLFSFTSSAVIASFYYYDFISFILHFLPFSNLFFFHITEAFYSFIHLSLFISFLFTLPLIFYFVYLFITPALYKFQEQYLFKYFIFHLLFLIPFYFLIFIPYLWPNIISFFYEFSNNKLNYLGSINDILKFLYNLSFIFIIFFQIPWIFNKFKKIYVRNRSIFIFTLLLIFALVTPPDIFSLILTFIPTILIIEIMVLLMF